MPRNNKRSYVSPLRAAAAAETHGAILAAAQEAFETRGWTGTTISQVAAGAGVSLKTVQAQFGTKARLLAETVDYAIRGDVEAEPIVRREAARAIEAAPDAATALARHAAMVTAINTRAASLAAVVEAAAPSDPAVGELWHRMRHNMRFGITWAAGQILDKPGHRPRLTMPEAETIFEIAMAWSTYRILRDERRLSPGQIERWIGQYYTRMLLS